MSGGQLPRIRAPAAKQDPPICMFQRSPSDLPRGTAGRVQAPLAAAGMLGCRAIYSITTKFLVVKLFITIRAAALRRPVTMTTEPVVYLGTLNGADGSAQYSAHGYTVLAAVNGPIEVQRRDEIPDAAAIDVIIRPAAGVGTVRERHFESIIEKSLGSLIMVNEFPRTQIQIILQVMESPELLYSYGKMPAAASNIEILPALLNAAQLALLDSSIPMLTTCTTHLIAVLDPKDELVMSPSQDQLRSARSKLVVSITHDARCPLMETEGPMEVPVFEAAFEMALEAAIKPTEVMDVENQDSTPIASFLHKALSEKMLGKENW